MNKEIENKILNAFSSLRTTDSVSIDNLDELKLVKRYYEDSFNFVNSIMTNEDQFIIGRRGTGKSTLLYRAYIDCLDTWNAEAEKQGKILPVFIDLSESFNKKEVDESNLEKRFITELYRCLKKMIYRFWYELGDVPSDFVVDTTHDNIDSMLEELKNLLIIGRPFQINEIAEEKKSSTQKRRSHRFNVSKDILNYDFESENNNGSEATETFKKKNEFTITEFLDYISAIKDEANISSIYIFIDEFSELANGNQLLMAELLKRISGNRRGIYLKVVAITDNYLLGPIRLQRDFYEINLDFYKFVERSSSLTDAFKNLEKNIEKILNKRLEAYGVSEAITDLGPDNILELLSRSSVGVMRTLGIILKESWNHTIASGLTKINKTTLEYGINYSGDAYHSFFKNNIGISIPKFYEDMLNDILERARKERKKSQQKAAGLFLISNYRDNHFKFLIENYLLHQLKKGSETTVKGETAKSLYLIDFTLIRKNNLGFDLDRDLIRQQRFLYDETISTYDHFFSETKLSYRCNSCHKEYTEQQLYIPAMDTTLSFCPKCNVQLEKIQPKQLLGNSFTEEERKIIGTLLNYDYANAILAKEVAEIVGCSSIKVGKFLEKIEPLNLVVRERIDGEAKPYRYYNSKME